MAIQFLPPEQDQGFGLLGNLLGLGLGGLGGYSLGQRKKAQKQEDFQAFGASQEEAKALARAPETQQTAWLNNKMKSAERERQAQLFSSLVGGGQQQPIQQPMIPQMMQPVAPQEEVGLQGTLGALGGPEQQQIPQPTQQQTPDINQLMGGRSVEQLQEWRDNVLRSGGDPKMIQDAVTILDRQISEKTKIESGEKKQQLAERKQEMQEKKQSYLEQKDIDQETKPFYDSVKERVKSAQENNMRLSRQKEKIKEGKLIGPGFYRLMKSMGIPLDPNSAEFEKLTNDFLKNAKATFGARLTDFDVKTFLSTVPSLDMPDPAKLQLINNLEIFNEAAQAENNAMKKIIKENGGRRPRNLEDLIEERTKDIKDKLAQQFKEGLSEIPEETLGQQLERVLTGPIASAVKTGGGALIGGLLGGPIGAAAGGTIGSGALGSLLSRLGKQ